MRLWIEWFRCVQALRTACTRTRTFMWMALILAGFCIRPDLAGVTSFVRALRLAPACYHRLLNLFHTDALRLDMLTSLWVRLTLKLFQPLRLGERPVLVADGLKAAKEGRKMPAVKKLHQESQDNSKPAFIFGHSFQAIGLLVQGALGRVACVPLTSRIHEGVVFSNRHRRTLLDKLVQMFLPVAKLLDRPCILVADAFYASGKIIKPFLAQGHHLVTRVRSTSVAFREPIKPKKRGRGQPRRYGEKVVLRHLWKNTKRAFKAVDSPVYGEEGVVIHYYCVDLLWRPVGKLVRFVLVDHPTRGRIILMTSDTSLEPMEVIRLYGYRFKIEVSFKQAIRTLGSYGYHFWMANMARISRRRSGDQYLHMKSEAYRNDVRRKIGAYHRYVQLACIAQGLLQHLALNFRATVWNKFGSWLRTMKRHENPSEAVVAHALRSSLPEFLLGTPDTHELKVFIAHNADLTTYSGMSLAG